jgi:ubiquinone/menaquinone biosynthesis C-methylase UbiE
MYFMHTKLKVDNSCGHNRYGFAWHYVPAAGGAHLDFGCGDGAFLAALKAKAIKRLVGVDVSMEAVEKARERCADVEIVRISGSMPLSFADGEFSSITILDVIEHIDKQQAVLRELNRLLSNDGVLIITVPGKHIFSFLDIGNLKFRFPRLHRWYYCRKHSVAEYERRYLSNPDGLVGDVSAGKRWHQHFSRRELANLLEQSGFEVVEFDGAGLFARVLKCIGFLCGRLKVLHHCMSKLEYLDAKTFESANLFCVVRKRA